MKKYLLPITFTMVLSSSAVPSLQAQTDMTFSDREGIEWCDVWIPHANETTLPRVLLVGDSITRGYGTAVEKQMEGKAYVGRLCTSCFVTDPVLLANLRIVLQAYKFDVIHFNNGMHGWSHSEEEYAQGLPPLLATLRKYAPNAKLIWANTTPLNEGAPKSVAKPAEPTDAAKADAAKLMLQADLRSKSNVRVKARNELAAKLMQSEKIPIDDLHALVLGHAELYSGDVHFNGNGTALQVRQVATEIARVLGN